MTKSQWWFLVIWLVVSVLLIAVNAIDDYPIKGSLMIFLILFLIIILLGGMEIFSQQNENDN